MEARVRQEEKDMAELENILMSVMAQEVSEAIIKLEKDITPIW